MKWTIKKGKEQSGSENNKKTLAGVSVLSNGQVECAQALAVLPPASNASSRRYQESGAKAKNVQSSHNMMVDAA